MDPGPLTWRPPVHTGPRESKPERLRAVPPLSRLIERSTMKTSIQLKSAVVSGVASGVFWLAYYTFYFKWRSCFDTQGRCFDGETGAVYHAQSAVVWLPIATIMTCVLLYQLWRFIR